MGRYLHNNTVLTAWFLFHLAPFRRRGGEADGGGESQPLLELPAQQDRVEAAAPRPDRHAQPTRRGSLGQGTFEKGRAQQQVCAFSSKKYLNEAFFLPAKFSFALTE